MATALMVFAGCGSSSSSSRSSSTAQQSTQTTAQTRAGPTIAKEPFKRPASPGAHPGAKVDHLIVKNIARGSGPELQAGDSGIFDFISTNWITGRAVEASWQRKRPFETRIEHGVVIDGWWQGIPGMRVGGRRQLIIPPSLGFTQSFNSEVTGATIYYDVVLLGIRPNQPPAMGGGAASGQ